MLVSHFLKNPFEHLVVQPGKVKCLALNIDLLIYYLIDKIFLILQTKPDF